MFSFEALSKACEYSVLPPGLTPSYPNQLSSLLLDTQFQNDHLLFVKSGAHSVILTCSISLKPSILKHSLDNTFKIKDIRDLKFFLPWSCGCLQKQAMEYDLIRGSMPWNYSHMLVSLFPNQQILYEMCPQIAGKFRTSVMCRLIGDLPEGCYT